MEHLKIVDIAEADYGCEASPDGAMVLVTLEAPDGSRRQIEVADALLYERQLDVGSAVRIGADGTLEAAP